jgi:hypothetical protein
MLHETRISTMLSIIQSGRFPNLEFLNTVMIDDLDSLCNSKNTLEKNQNKNDWLNFMQIFSLKKILRRKTWRELY